MGKIEKKYVATVMNRTYVTADSYIFTCLNAVVGEYDEKRKIFTDTSGNEYMYMLSDQALDTDVPYSVFNIRTIDDLKDVVIIDEDEETNG